MGYRSLRHTESSRDASDPGQDPRSRRPRLLFLSQTLPYPPDGGVTIRTFNILRLLSEEFQIKGLCFYRAEDQPTREYVNRNLAALREVADLEAFPIPQEHSRLRFVYDHLRSVARRQAYTLYAYESRNFKVRLEELLRTDHFDLVHVDSMDLAGYLPLLQGHRVVCVHHNAESMLLRRRGRMEHALWRRAYLLLQSKLLEKVEQRWCPGVALNVAVSEQDCVALRELTSGSFVVVPNGVDTEKYRPGETREHGIICAGGLNWLPNQDGLDFFCEDILPLIRRHEPHVSVRWVGRAGASEQDFYSSRYGVELTGYVDDVRPYVAEAACYVVPLRIGGGTRLKVLDAWSMGKAVVTTSIGCEGLRAVDGENLLVRDSVPDFAAAVLDVLRDSRLRRRLGQDGRATVEEFYGWRVIGRDMIEHYRSLVAGD